MDYTYTLIKNSSGDILSISRSDGASIPVCDGNRDYSQYLIDVDNGATVDEQVIPEPEAPQTSADSRFAAIEAWIIEQELGL